MLHQTSYAVLGNIPISLKYLLSGIIQIKTDTSHCKNCVLLLDLLIYSAVTKYKAIGERPRLNPLECLADVEIFYSFMLLLETAEICALLSTSVPLLNILNVYFNALVPVN